MKVSDNAQTAYRDFQILQAIEQDENASQRDIAGRIGLALGLTNQIIKRLIRKGLVKTSRVNAKRVAYYLTVQGFTEKLKLVMDYAETTVSFFSEVRQAVRVRLAELQREQGVSSVAILGTGELAEAVYLSAQELGLDLVAVHAEDGQGTNWFGVQITAPTEATETGADVLIVTCMKSAQEQGEKLTEAPVNVLFMHELLSKHISLFAERIEEEA